MNLLLGSAFGVPLALLTLTLWLAAALSVEARLPRQALMWTALTFTVLLLAVVIGRFLQVA
mgnify:CR=1 FL=1|jgi:hypothetical protein